MKDGISISTRVRRTPTGATANLQYTRWQSPLSWILSLVMVFTLFPASPLPVTAQTAPTFDAASYSFTIAENSDASIGTVTATSGETITYALSTNATDLMISIDSMTGEISPPSTGLDREALDTFDINNPTNPVTLVFQVSASIPGASTSTDVTLTVTDVNEPPEISVNPPQDPIQLYSGREYLFDFEPGGVPYFVDPEGGELTYEIYMANNPRTDTRGNTVAPADPGYDAALPAYLIEGTPLPLATELVNSMPFTLVDERFISIEGTVASIIGGRTEQTHKSDTEQLRRNSNIDNISPAIVVSARDPEGNRMYDLLTNALGGMLVIDFDLQVDTAAQVQGPDRVFLAQSQAADTLVYPFEEFRIGRWDYTGGPWPRWFLLDRSGTAGDNNDPKAGTDILCYEGGAPVAYNANDQFWTVTDEADHTSFDIGPNRNSRLVTQTAINYQSGGDNLYDVVVGAFSGANWPVSGESRLGCTGHALPLEIEVLDIAPPGAAETTLPSATTVDAAGNTKIYSGRTTSFATNSHQGSGEAGTWFAYDTTAFPPDQIEWTATAKHDSIEAAHDRATGRLDVTPTDVSSADIVPIRLEVDNFADELPALQPSGSSATANAMLHPKLKDTPAEVVPLAHEFLVQVEPEPPMPHILPMLVDQTYEVDISDWFDIRTGSTITVNSTEIGTQATVTPATDVANGTASLTITSPTVTTSDIDLTITHVNGMITDSVTIPMKFVSTADATYKIPPMTNQEVAAADIFTTAAGQTLNVIAMTGGEATVTSPTANEFTVTSGTIPQGSDSVAASVVFIPTEATAVTDNPPYIIYELEVENLPAADDVLNVLITTDLEVDLSDYFFFHEDATPTWVGPTANVPNSIAEFSLDAQNNTVTVDGVAPTSTDQTFTVSHGTGGTPEDWVFPDSIEFTFRVLDAPYRPASISIPAGETLVITNVNSWFNVVEGIADYLIKCDAAATPTTTCSATNGSGQNLLTAGVETLEGNTNLTMTVGSVLTTEPLTLTIDSGLRSANAGENVAPETIDLEIQIVADQYQALVGSDLVLDVSDWFFHHTGGNFALEAASGDTAILTTNIDADEELTITPVATGVTTTVTISRQTGDATEVSPETYTIDVTVVDAPTTTPPTAANPLVLYTGRADTFDITSWFVTNDGYEPTWTLDDTDTPSATLGLNGNIITATGIAATADETTETFDVSHDQTGKLFPDTQTIHYVVSDAPYTPPALAIPRGEMITADVADWFSVGSESASADYMILCDPAGTLATTCSATDSSFTAALSGSSLTITATQTLSTAPITLTIDSGLRNANTGESVTPETVDIEVSVVTNEFDLLAGSDLVLDLGDWFFHQDGAAFTLDAEPADPNTASASIGANNQLTISPVAAGSTTITVSRQSADDTVVNPEDRSITVNVLSGPSTPPPTISDPLVFYIDQDQELDFTDWFVNNDGFDPTWELDDTDTGTTFTITEDDTLVITDPVATPDGMTETITISHDLTNGVYPPSQTIHYVVRLAPPRPATIAIPQENSLQIDVSNWFSVVGTSADYMISCPGGQLGLSCAAADGSFTATLSGSDLTIAASTTASSAPVPLTIDSGLRNTNEGESVVPEMISVDISVVPNTYSATVGTDLTVDASDWFYHADGTSFTLAATSSDTTAATVTIDANNLLTITPVDAGNTNIDVSRLSADDAVVFPESYQISVTVAAAPTAGGGAGPFFGGPPPVAAAPEIRDYFSDDDGTTHEANINLMAHFGISRGCNPPTNTNYCPFRDISRAEMATFISRVLELAPATEDRFDDDGESVHESAINRMAAAQLTVGCNPGSGGDRYCPENPVTRGEMASFLSRSLMLTEEGGDFVDIDDSVHASQIGRIALRGITRGCNPPTNDRYCPDRPITRGEMATMLVRAFPATFGN